MKNKLRKVLLSYHPQIYQTAYGYLIEIRKMNSEEMESILDDLSDLSPQTERLEVLQSKKKTFLLIIEISWDKANLAQTLARDIPFQWPSLSSILKACQRKPSTYLFRRLAEELVKSADLLIKKKFFQTAEKILALAVAYNWNEEENHLQLSRLYLIKGFFNSKKAENHLNAFVKLFPKNKKILLELGKLYMEQERMKEALQSFENYISLNPGDPEGYVLLGKAKIVTEDSEEAKRYFLSAMKLDSNYLPTFLPLARCYINLNNYDKARVILKLYLERERGNFMGFHLLAEVYRHMGELRKAKKNFKRALKLNPDNITGYHQLAQIYDDLGDERKSDKLMTKYYKWKRILDKYGGLKVIPLKAAEKRKKKR